MALHQAILFTPIALGLMVVEYGIGRSQGRQIYGFSSMVSDLCCSVGHLVSMGLLGLSGLVTYDFVAEGAGVFHFDLQSPWAWVVGFLLSDFVFWLRHLCSHQISVLWAIHAVHHQSHDFNFGTAQRSPWLHALQSLPFVGVLAALGLPIEMAGVFYVATFVWQFFCHTQVVGRLGPMEWVFVTPSHHRVHHACNEGYLDRNHGGILIIWDRLFGTFADESEAPVYGTVKPVPTHGVLAANLAPWLELWNRMQQVDGMLRKVEVALRPPSWDPVSRVERAPVVAAERHGPPEGDPGSRPLVLLGFGLALCIALAGLQLGSEVPGSVRLPAVLGMWILVGMLSSTAAPGSAAAPRLQRAR